MQRKSWKRYFRESGSKAAEESSLWAHIPPVPEYQSPVWQQKPVSWFLFDWLRLVRFLDMATLARRIYPIDFSHLVAFAKRLLENYCHQVRNNQKIRLKGTASNSTLTNWDHLNSFIQNLSGLGWKLLCLGMDSYLYTNWSGELKWYWFHDSVPTIIDLMTSLFANPHVIYCLAPKRRHLAICSIRN